MKRLDETDTLIKTLIEEINRPAMVCDLTFQILAKNTLAQELYLSHLQEKDSIPTLFQAFPFLQPYKEALTKAQEEQAILQLPDSENAHLSFTLKPLPLKEPLSLVLIGSDPLVALKEKLERNERLVSLGKLSAFTAHELNNPIGFISASTTPLMQNLEDIYSILTALEECRELDDASKLTKVSRLLKEMQDKDIAYAIKEIKQLLSGIADGASRLVNIVKGVKTLSRMQDDESLLNIEKGIDTTLYLLHHQIKHDVIVNKEYETVPEILCNPVKINQVLLNILANAIEAMPGHKGTLWIKTYVEKNQAVISIKDNGSGVPQEIQQQIFDPFFTTKSSEQGSGLGLAISKSIIEEHGGSIALHSTLGVGSEFVIKLPIVSPREAM